MASNGKINIYEMFIANGHKVGFFVRRETWGSETAAKVTSIGGKFEGKDALTGESPYFNNPVVTMEVIWGREGGRANQYWGIQRDKLSCPGSYRYYRISRPSWWPEDSQGGS